MIHCSASETLQRKRVGGTAGDALQERIGDRPTERNHPAAPTEVSGALRTNPKGTDRRLAEEADGTGGHVPGTADTFLRQSKDLVRSLILFTAKTCEIKQALSTLPGQRCSNATNYELFNDQN
eukprot:295021_1